MAKPNHQLCQKKKLFGKIIFAPTRRFEVHLTLRAREQSIMLF